MGIVPSDPAVIKCHSGWRGGKDVMEESCEPFLRRSFESELTKIRRFKAT